MLTTGQNRCRNFVNFRCRKNEHDVGRRLFQRLQQRVEGRIRQHVDFVDDVDAVRAAERREFDILADLTHVVHAGIGGAIDLDHIDRCPLRNLLAIGRTLSRACRSAPARS